MYLWINFETAVVCLLLVRLFMFQREKDEWRDDWSLLKYWLFRGFTRGPLQLAQSALKALGSFVVCSKEAVYCMGYTKACIQRCKYTLVYTKRRQQYLE